MTEAIMKADGTPPQIGQWKAVAKKVFLRLSAVMTLLFMSLPSYAAPISACAAGGGAASDFQDFLDSVVNFAHSPFMVAIAIVAVILGCVMAIGGNIKTAFFPFGLAAIIALGPWLVITIFNMFASVGC